MKRIKLVSFFIIATLCLTNTQCDDDDNGFANQIVINNNTIVQIENNQTSFNINESIVIETNILNEQITTDNQNVLLTNYDYSEIGQSQYQHALRLYKLNSFGTVSEIPLTIDNLTSIEGEVAIENGIIKVRSIYDGTSYKNKFSITLLEAGTFYLSGGKFPDSNGEFNINGGVYERGFVNINSIIMNANANGNYEFIVN